MRVSIKPIGLQRLEPTNIEIDFLYRLIKLPLSPYIWILWTPTVHFYFKKLLKEIKRNKIVRKETPECCFSQGHTEPTGTYGKVLSEKKKKKSSLEIPT